MCEGNKRIMTTDAVRPVGDNPNLLTVGHRGPIVFEDFLLLERWRSLIANEFRGAWSTLSPYVRRRLTYVASAIEIFFFLSDERSVLRARNSLDFAAGKEMPRASAVS